MKLLPLIPSVLGQLTLTYVDNTETTLDFTWNGIYGISEYTVTYNAFRPDMSASGHDDFAEQTLTVNANATTISGLTAARSFKVKVCGGSGDDEQCDEGEFRTDGRAVYITSISHYDNGTLGGKYMYGAIYHDQDQDCADVFSVKFSTCEISNFTLFGSNSDPSLRQYDGVDFSTFDIAVGNGFRGDYMTFSIELAEDTTDLCWNGVADLGENPAVDNVAVNETIQANMDFYGARINSEGVITITGGALDDRTTETSEVVPTNNFVFTDIFDEFGNNVTNDAGVDQGYAMQNQTNFAIFGQMANSTFTLFDAACPWSVTIQFPKVGSDPDFDGCQLSSAGGSMDWTVSDATAGSLTYEAETADAHTGVFFFEAKVSAPQVLDGCDEDNINGAISTVTMRQFN